MDRIKHILANYNNRRHLLQTVHIQARPFGGPNFLYMKNHKAACTNILTLLITHMHHALGADRRLKFSMKRLHNLPADYLRAGARNLDWQIAQDALIAPGWFRFTMVREPMRRTVSAWADKMQSLEKPRHRQDLMKYLGRDPESFMALSEFLDVIAQDEGARDIDRHWRPQHKEISFGLIDYDLIGRVEAMDEARRQIVSTLFGTDAHKIDVVDTRDHLGHRSSSREHLENLTAQDRRNIERAFAQDFEMYETISKKQAA